MSYSSQLDHQDKAMFIGRDYELRQLQTFAKRKTAGMLVCRGRRRIGKSTLIEHFAKQCKNTHFVELYGLAPRKKLTNQDQLKHFGELLGNNFNIPAMQFSNWNDALNTLAGLTNKGRFIILLDEISWMASRDKDFAGKLKGIWDTKFKMNNQLILILCGSVTSWIDDNILNDKGFMGRVSLTITLNEMSLKDANKFWQDNKLISAYEKFKMLCITGGIPRYLEEIDTDHSAEHNIKRICFSKEGMLFSEFENIFKDIFESRAAIYKEIILALSNGSLASKDISKKLGVGSTGGLSKKLKILTQSGFVSCDAVWNKSGKLTGLKKYRLSDNYLRFYVKYIEPKKVLIEKELYQNISLENLPEWNTLMGFQFENLILNNILDLIKKLNITPESVLSAAPYFQRKTLRQEACQVDLLIQTKFTTYICEIKFRQKIDSSVIKEMAEKIRKIKFSKNTTIRPVLIYQGEVAPTVMNENFFADIINFEQFLRS